jgi:hypothetical protein
MSEKAEFLVKLAVMFGENLRGQPLKGRAVTSKIHTPDGDVFAGDVGVVVLEDEDGDVWVDFDPDADEIDSIHCFDYSEFEVVEN